jgi:hypothetical protein
MPFTQRARTAAAASYGLEIIQPHGLFHPISPLNRGEKNQICSVATT